MKNLHDELFHQIDYISLESKQTVSFIKTMVKEWGIGSIIDEIIEVLQSNKEEEIFIISLLLRDVCTYKNRIIDFDEIVDQFRPALEKSEIFQLMNQNLYSDDRLIRESTYTTFGKMSLPQNAIYLKKAIDYYKEHFPDQLERLEFEYKWLLKMAWKVVDNSLVNEFEFTDFNAAVAFVNKILPLAEEANHHPDILIHSYNKVKVTLFTNFENKITVKDYILADKINVINKT